MTGHIARHSRAVIGYTFRPVAAFRSKQTMQKTSPQLIWRQAALVRSVELPLESNLILSGCRFRPKRQMPVLAGPAESVRDIVGSIRNLAIRRGVLCGNLRWCSDSTALATQAKFDSGTLSFRLDVAEWEACILRAGETLSGVTGPARVVSRWQPVSVSLVPAGVS